MVLAGEAMTVLVSGKYLSALSVMCVKASVAWAGLDCGWNRSHSGRLMALDTVYLALGNHLISVGL